MFGEDADVDTNQVDSDHVQERPKDQGEELVEIILVTK